MKIGWKITENPEHIIVYINNIILVLTYQYNTW